MKYSIEKLLNSKIKIKGFLDKDEFQKYIETILDELKNTSQIPGFRKGQIPENILIEKIGKENILQNAAQEAVEDLYFKAIKEDNLEVVSKPQIRILKLAGGNPFEFEIEVEILPKIELPDYKKIAKEIKKEEVFVSDEEIKETIGWILKSRAQFEDLKREAQKGDFVEIEYSCLDIENGKTFHDAFYLGQGHFVEGFEDQLLGMNPGQEKEFTILKEKIKNPNLPQKDLIFKVKLNKVQKVNIPDLTDDFVKTLGNFNNIDDLKKNIREGLELEKENALKEKWRGEFFKNLKEKVEISLPEGLVEYQKEKLFEDLKERVKEELKIEFEDYLKQIKKTEEEILKTLRLQAEELIKNEILLKEIIEKEKIEVSEEEVEREINNFVKNFPDVETLKKEVDLERLKNYYKEILKKEKVFQLLYNL